MVFVGDAGWMICWKLGKRSGYRGVLLGIPNVVAEIHRGKSSRARQRDRRVACKELRVTCKEL